MKPKIDICIQGAPHAEVEKEEGETRWKQFFGRFVSAITNHEHALTAELQSKHPFYAVQ